MVLRQPTADLYFYKKIRIAVISCKPPISFVNMYIFWNVQHDICKYIKRNICKLHATL